MVGTLSLYSDEAYLLLLFCSHNTERTQWDHPLLVKTMEELGNWLYRFGFRFQNEQVLVEVLLSF